MKQVTTIQELASVASNRQCVFVPKMMAWKTRRPAAFVMCLQGYEICKMLNAGMYVYEPKKQPKTEFYAAVRKNK